VLLPKKSSQYLLTTLRLHQNAIPIFCKDTELKITLWGAQAKDFSIDSVYSSNNSTPVVLFVGYLPQKICKFSFHNYSSSRHYLQL